MHCTPPAQHWHSVPRRGGALSSPTPPPPCSPRWGSTERSAAGVRLWMGVFTAPGRPSVCGRLIKNPRQSPTNSTACWWVLTATSRFTSRCLHRERGGDEQGEGTHPSVRPAGWKSQPWGGDGGGGVPSEPTSGGGEGAQPLAGVSALWGGHISTVWEWGTSPEMGDGGMDSGDRRTAKRLWKQSLSPKQRPPAMGYGVIVPSPHPRAMGAQHYGVPTYTCNGSTAPWGPHTPMQMGAQHCGVPMQKELSTVGSPHPHAMRAQCPQPHTQGWDWGCAWCRARRATLELHGSPLRGRRMKANCKAALKNPPAAFSSVPRS